VVARVALDRLRVPLHSLGVLRHGRTASADARDADVGARRGRTLASFLE
jgi:hypothetical protein